jgi:hypothetical protein
LQGAVGGVAGVEQQARAQGADGGDLGGQLVGAHGVHGEVEPDAEQLALAAGHPVRQVVGVLGGGFDMRIVQASVFGGAASSALELRQLRPQPARGRHRVDGFDVHRDVDPTGIGKQRGEPAEVHLAGEPDDRQRGDALAVVADLQVPGRHGQGVGDEGRDRRQRAGARPVTAGATRAHRRPPRT